jgi:hypothetical protein
MKIVIDLPKEYYEALKEMSDETLSIIDRAIIRYGTPLPEKHGRLIDADAIPRHLVRDMDEIDKQPTIIEGSDAECQKV